MKRRQAQEEVAAPAEEDFSVYVSRILNHLKATGPLSREELPIIFQDLPEGFDLEGLWNALLRNPYTAHDPSTNKLQFEHELLHVRPQNLRAYIEGKKSGVSREELLQYNADMSTAINELLRTAGVLGFLGWRGGNLKTLVMYPRGTDFKVPVSGTVSGKQGSMSLDTTHDLSEELRRGDAIVVDGTVYRVSLEESSNAPLEGVIGGGEKEEERGPPAARAGVKRGLDPIEMLERTNEFSSGSISAAAAGLPERQASAVPTRFKFPFDAKHLPLDKPLKSAVENIQVYKYGCTNDVREVYWKVAGNAANNYEPSQAGKLDEALIKNNCLTEATLEGINHNHRELLELRAKRLADAAKGDQRKKQKRNNVNKKITNEHML